MGKQGVSGSRGVASEVTRGDRRRVGGRPFLFARGEVFSSHLQMTLRLVREEAELLLLHVLCGSFRSTRPFRGDVTSQAKTGETPNPAVGARRPTRGLLRDASRVRVGRLSVASTPSAVSTVGFCQERLCPLPLPVQPRPLSTLRAVDASRRGRRCARVEIPPLSRPLVQERQEV